MIISITVDMPMGVIAPSSSGKAGRSPGNRPSSTITSVPATKIIAEVLPPLGTGCSMIGGRVAARVGVSAPPAGAVTRLSGGVVAGAVGGVAVTAAVAPTAVVTPPNFASYRSRRAAGTSTVPAFTRLRYSGSSSRSLPMRCCTNEVTMHATIAAGTVIARICGRP